MARLVQAGLLAVVLLGWTPLAHAQEADGGDDAGLGSDAGDAGTELPDASAGEGCADCSNEGSDDNVGRIVTTCEFSNDCTRGFVCRSGRCEWSRYIDATGGFCGVVSAMLLAGGVFFMTRKRS